MNMNRFIFKGLSWGLVWLLGLSSSIGSSQSIDEAAIDKNNFKNYYELSPLISTAGLVNSEGLAELKSLGYKYVIDLRLPIEGIEEERLEVQRLGMTYINLPVGKIWPEDTILEQFKAILDTKDSKPILIHCTSGNRVGMIWSYYQIISGVDVESALSEGRKIGMRSRWEAALKSRFSIADP